MAGILAWVLSGLLLGAAAASGEVYRCVAEDGAVRFVDAPHACPGAERHVPRARGGRIEPSAPAPEPAQPAAVAPAEGPADPPPDLEAVFLSKREVAGRWEVIGEASTDPSGDPDLARWGVREQQTRHYTRDVRGTAEVCSVEIWSFRTAGQARAARQGFAYPGWHFEQRGPLLIMLRGITRPRGERGRRGLFPDCRRLGDRIAARASR